MKTLCVIPAKATSKRIPGKNLKAFCGKPVILYAIELAHAIGLTVVVSSDSEEIGELAVMNGCSWRDRPAELCADDTPMFDVVADTLSSRINATETVVMLYPCSPLAQVQDIQEGLHLVREHHVAYPVYKSHDTPERSLILDGDSVVPRYPEFKDVNSNEFTQSYHSAGQWYVADVAWLLMYRTFTPYQAGYVEIPASRAIDIDTLEDWALAEGMYESISGV